MEPKNGGRTNIQKKQNQFNQNYNYNMNNPHNYNKNKQSKEKEINTITHINFSNSKNILNNIDNNVCQEMQVTNNYNNTPITEDKCINQKKIENLNPKRKKISKTGNKKENKELNNNKNNKAKYFDNFETPQGDDEQDIRNFYKYLQKEYEENKGSNNSPYTIIEKEQNELIMNDPFSFSEFTKPSLVNIENVGNSSYMSANIRILANIEKIVKYYLKKLNIITDNFQDIPLSYAFSRIIFHLYPFPQDSLKKSISLNNFYRTALLLNSAFIGKTTKNAIDFLTFLLETLHNDDKKLRNQNNNGDNNNDKIKEFEDYAIYLDQNEKSIIFDNFAWINKKVTKCNNCVEEKMKFQYYFTYEANIFDSLDKVIMEKKKNINIYDCLQYQSDNKKSYNHYCYNCKNKCTFTEENTICATPKYFIFLLFNEDKTIKKFKESNIQFLIDQELKLNDIVKGQTINYLYEPIGKVDYYFQTKEYISSCCSPIDNNWYKYENENKKYNISKIQFKKDNNDNKTNDNFIYNSNYTYLPVIVVYKIKN